MRRRRPPHGDHEDSGQEEEKEEGQEEQGRDVGDQGVQDQGSRRQVSTREGVAEEVGVVDRRLTPLAESRLLLNRVHAAAEKVVVGLSGGKDSLATLDLCVATFGAENVSCFYMYMVKGLRCVEATIRWAERRYGVEVLMLPHWQLGRAYKYAVYMPHRHGADEWRDMKMGDVEQLARQRTGARWIAYGHRSNDSIERVAMLSANGGLDEVGRRVYPLRAWNEAAVRAYLRAKRIPSPPKLTFLKRASTGVSFQEDVLLTIKERYPDDYARILEVFPYVDAKLARHELKRSSWKQETYVDKWRTSLKGRR